MAVDEGFQRTSEANRTNLISNLSLPVVLFELKDFNIFYTSFEVTEMLREKSLLEKDLKLTCDLIYGY